jgi:transcription antitermination factor NusG
MKRGDIVLVTTGPHKGSVGQIVFLDHSQSEVTMAFDSFKSLLKIPLEFVKSVM